jgi:hypothetical protein
LIRPFQTIPTGDSVLDRLQARIDAAFAKLLQLFPMLSGVLVEDVILTALQPNLIDHGLGRKPFGYFVVKSNAGATVYTADVDPSLASRVMDVRTTADAVVSIWVF